MLVVRAEIWPGGDGRYAYAVGEITAANESNLAPVSSYTASINQSPAPDIGIAGWERTFTIEHHHRSTGVWALAAAIIAKAVDIRADGRGRLTVKDETYQPPIHLVRALAGRGQDRIDEYQALVDHARAMLASGALTEEDITAYPWELEPAPTQDQPRKAWAAHVGYCATGEGMTTTLFIALARNEAELRQMLSRRLSRDAAEAATVAPGLDELDQLEPGASVLAPARLRKWLRDLENGADGAAVFTFFAQSYANYG